MPNDIFIAAFAQPNVICQGRCFTNNIITLKTESCGITEHVVMFKFICFHCLSSIMILPCCVILVQLELFICKIPTTWSSSSAMCWLVSLWEMEVMLQQNLVKRCGGLLNPRQNYWLCWFRLEGPQYVFRTSTDPVNVTKPCLGSGFWNLRKWLKVCSG